MEYKKLRVEFTKPSFRKEMIKELGNKCVNCGSSENIEYHHIVPLNNGGTNKLSNIVPLCEKCHFKAHKKEYTKPKNGGRPKLIEYKEAEPILRKYFNLEIGLKEAKKLLGIAHKNKTTWYKLTDEYRQKYNISSDFRNNIDILNSQERRIKSSKYIIK